MILCYFTASDRLCIKKRLKTKLKPFQFSRSMSHTCWLFPFYTYLAEETKYSICIMLREEFQSSTLYICCKDWNSLPYPVVTIWALITLPLLLLTDHSEEMAVRRKGCILLALWCDFIIKQTNQGSPACLHLISSIFQKVYAASLMTVLTLKTLFS